MIPKPDSYPGSCDQLLDFPAFDNISLDCTVLATGESHEFGFSCKYKYVLNASGSFSNSFQRIPFKEFPEGDPDCRDYPELKGKFCVVKDQCCNPVWQMSSTYCNPIYGEWDGSVAQTCECVTISGCESSDPCGGWPKNVTLFGTANASIACRLEAGVLEVLIYCGVGSENNADCLGADGAQNYSMDASSGWIPASELIGTHEFEVEQERGDLMVRNIVWNFTVTVS